MGIKLSKQTGRELLEALRERYRNASKIDKTKILDEFIVVVGCHRKHAIRLLTESIPSCQATQDRPHDLFRGGPPSARRPLGGRRSESVANASKRSSPG